ncbi:antifreeze protein [Ochrobactrum sp. CGA5]|uniref:antifreeze protein n=1 Tax=Ochrobactrum sp. CGA5 TaxID=2583453 RepID=UPI00111FC66F|nr:antifreeze protein [Ochrobactrum sp. CGA5]
MSAISLKSLVVTAALGAAAIFTTAASASAASPIVAPVVTTSAGTAVVNIDYRGYRHGRPVYRGPACSVEGARMKAHRMGIRNARVIYRGKSVRVRGFRHGRPVGVVFANVRGCPIIR